MRASSNVLLAGQTVVNPTFTGIVSGVTSLLASSFAAVSCGADVTEDTLATITVPANQIGANGMLRITTHWSMTSSVNNKTIKVHFSGLAGTAFMQGGPGLTSRSSAIIQTWIANTNATNTQTGGSWGLDSSGTAAAAQTGITAVVDTTASTTIVITGQKASAGETLTLVGYTVELIR